MLTQTPLPHNYPGLIDLYTGRLMVVVMTEMEGSITYSVPGATSTMVPRADKAALLALLSTRNGIAGLATPEETLKCPYTGNTLAVQTLGDGRAFATGGFDPTRPNADIFNFLYNARMRNGTVAPGTCAHAPTFVASIAVPPPKAEPPKSSDPSASAIETAEKAISEARGASRRRK